MITSQSTRSLFSGENIASTGYVYTSDGSSGINDGWVSGKYNNIVAQIGCGTLTNALTYRIEGRFPNSNRAASIDVGVFSTASNMDKYVQITPKMAEIRVGAKIASVPASPLGVPHNFYCSMIFTESS